MHPIRFIDSHGFETDSWLPVILLTVILAALHSTMLPELLANYDDPEYVSQFAERGKMSENAARDQIAEMRRLAPYMGLIEAPIVVSAGIAGVAAVLYLISRVQYRKKVSYRSLFSMVAWGSLLSAIPLLINLIGRLIRPDLLLPTNAAALLPDSAQGTYFYNILLAVDPFLVWQVWLMGLGLAFICQETRQRAITSVGTMFVVMSVVNALTMTMAGK